MKKEYMDSILAWSESECPLDIAFHYLHCVMTGLGLPPAEGALKSVRTLITQCVKYLTFSAVAFTLWTRSFHF